MSAARRTKLRLRQLLDLGRGGNRSFDCSGPEEEAAEREEGNDEQDGSEGRAQGEGSEGRARRFGGRGSRILLSGPQLSAHRPGLSMNSFALMLLPLRG